VELEKQANIARDLYPSPQNLDGARVLAGMTMLPIGASCGSGSPNEKMEVETAANFAISVIAFSRSEPVSEFSGTTEMDPLPRVLTSWRALTMRGNAGRSDG
jgi:hypothetical protein